MCNSKFSRPFGGGDNHLNGGGRSDHGYGYGDHDGGGGDDEERDGGGGYDEQRTASAIVLEEYFLEKSTGYPVPDYYHVQKYVLEPAQRRCVQRRVLRPVGFRTFQGLGYVVLFLL